MALRFQRQNKYALPSKRRLKWLYVGLFLVAVGLSLYLFGPFTRKEGSGGVAQKINFIEKEPEPKKVTKLETAGVEAKIDEYLASQTGTYGYSVVELDDGRQFGARDQKYYTAASTIKVAIFSYLYHQIDAGAINPDTKLTYTKADYETGTGSLQAEPIGSHYKVSYLAERMIVVSDNVATNMLVRTLGRSNIQAYLNSVGLTNVKMATNDVTPQGMTKLLQKIYNGEIMADEGTDLLFVYMKKSILPSRLVAGVPNGVPVAHKIGSWSGAMSDIGIVFADNRAYAIAVYSSEVGWGEETDAVIAGISKRVYEYEMSF